MVLNPTTRLLPQKLLKASGVLIRYATSRARPFGGNSNTPQVVFRRAVLAYS